MNKNTRIQLSPGRTYLGQNVLGVLGKETRLLGKSALILTDERVWPKVKDEVETALKAEGICWKIRFHEGHCCPGEYRETAGQAVEMGAGAVIGIGGGRVLDTAKISADHAGLRVITVPTCASTCAAAAWLSVEYTDRGAFVGNYWTEYPPFCAVVDTDVIVRRCPARYNLAGIVDAMAKYPEMEYNLNYSDQFERNAFSEVSVMAAEQNYRYFMENREELSHKFQNRILDSQVEDAIAKCISVTGLISCMACGGKQAAISHMLYSYVCCNHPDIAEGYLHGEIVGASLCYQLAVDEHPDKDLEDLRAFLCQTGMPAGLHEIGLKLTPEEEMEIFDFLKKRMPLTEEEVLRLRGKASEMSP